MGVRHLVAAAATLCILFSTATSAQASAACPTDLDVPTAASPDAVMALLCDINTLRGQAGLRPLRWDWHLWVGAQRMAQEIGQEHFFAHVTPDGRNVADRMEPTGYIPDTPTWVLSENLGWGNNAVSSPLAIALGWMNSPGHRENMMDPDMRDIGIGMAEATLDPGDGFIYVADFGTRGDDLSVTAAPPKPTPETSRAKLVGCRSRSYSKGTTSSARSVRRTTRTRCSR